MSSLTKEQMEREYQQWSMCLSKLHLELDTAGVPRADATVCDDPTCDSKILHRVRALTERLRIVEAERDELKEKALRWYRADGTFEVCASEAAVIERRKAAAKTLTQAAARRDLNEKHCAAIESLDAEISALHAELQRKDAALKIYQARAHRNVNSTCDGCPFAVAERDVNWADRAEGYYTCGLDGKERWGEDPRCPDALYKEPPCQTA